MPKDSKNFYGVGKAQNIKKAQNRAISSLRGNLSYDLNSEFKKQNNPLQKINQYIFAKILATNEHLSKTLLVRDIKIEKSMNFKNSQLILISIPKDSIFKQIDNISTKKLNEVKEKYKKYNETKYEVVDSKSALKRYKHIANLMTDYPLLVSYTQLKKSSKSNFDAENEINFLNKMAKDYVKQSSSINFYVLSDVNSMIYVKYIKKAFQFKGISYDRTSKDESSLKLLVSSSTDNSQEYSFNKSKTLIKFRIYDINKNEIAFRQHTFVGKSRKSYDDAKIQTAEYLRAKINKLGIFNFIGI